MNSRLTAAKAAFCDPDQATAKIPVFEMRDSSIPRDFDAEYKEQGFRIDHDLLRSSLHHPRMEGFALADGLAAIKAYQAGREGRQIESVIPWLRGEHDAE